MSEENKQIDSLQPSWAAHELFALALTLVLAIWIVSKYGKEARPQSLTTDRDEARATKLAELRKADEEALGSYGVVDESRKVYRIPVDNAMKVVVSRMQDGSKGLHGDLVARSQAAAGLAVVVPAEELNDPALIAQGKVLFQTKICFTCHQTDPAVPAPAGLALRAPVFVGEFWGKEREVHKGLGGPIEKVKFDAAYFVESIRKPMDKVLKGALAPMPPPPPTTDDELKALLAYVKSLSKK
jgi:mono/diheme cytochrome c family protein